MLLKNNTGKIIGIGMESILPGETKDCPIGYEKNPVVLQYIKNGTFEEIKEAAAAAVPEVDEEPKAKGKSKA